MKYIDPERFVYAEADSVSIDFDNNLTHVYCKKNSVFTTFDTGEIRSYFGSFPPELRLNYKKQIEYWKRTITIAKDVKENRVRLD